MDLARRLFSLSIMEWDLRFPLVHPSNSPFVKKKKNKEKRLFSAPSSCCTSLLFMSRPRRRFHSWLSSLRAQCYFICSIVSTWGPAKKHLSPTRELLEPKVLLEVRIQRGRAKNTYTLTNIRVDGVCMRALACFVRERSRGEFNSFSRRRADKTE